jgi:hypothetical protein
MGRCKVEECKGDAKYGFKGEKRQFCGEHKKNGMADLSKDICGDTKCIKIANFGHSIDDEVLYCFDHKKTTMVDVKSPKCQGPNCTRRAYYNFSDNKTPLYCLIHIIVGMINVTVKPCKVKGCNIRPCYGRKGKTPVYCATHGRDKRGLQAVRYNKCQNELCDKTPNFNFEGETKGIYCEAHAEEGMKNINAVMCKHSGCTKQASLGSEDEKEFCSTHAAKDMKQIYNKKQKN